MTLTKYGPWEVGQVLHDEKQGRHLLVTGIHECPRALLPSRYRMEARRVRPMTSPHDDGWKWSIYGPVVVGWAECRRGAARTEFWVEQALAYKVADPCAIAPDPMMAKVDP